MGGVFGVASKSDCSLDLFFGVDYHSHLGTRRGGLAVYREDNKFQRAIHNIQNSPFRTKFEDDIEEMKGHVGIGCISDYEPQPLIARSHLGRFAVTTVGIVTNKDALVKELMDNGGAFLEMSGGEINQTELILAMINTQKTILAGIQYVQAKIQGSITMLVATPEGIYGARDKWGRTPLQIGIKKDVKGSILAHCLSFESFAYLNLGYTDEHELHVPVDLLWLPHGDLRRRKRRNDALQLRKIPCAPRPRRQHSPRLCGGRSRQRHGTRRWLRKRSGHSLYASVHQIHPHLAALIYADQSGTAQPYCPHEVNSCAAVDKRQKHFAD